MFLGKRALIMLRKRELKFNRKRVLLFLYKTTLIILRKERRCYLRKRVLIFFIREHLYS